MNEFDSDPFELGSPPAPPPPRGVNTAAAAPPPPAFLDGLNEGQRAAVEALDGPVLVLAGAGTGKTRVLTTRLAYILMTRRAFPSQILAVTFTNKAAREMQERIGSLIGGAVEGMRWLGTFHSVGAQILRRHAELVGLTSNFTILDTDDQIRLIKQLLAAAEIDDKRWPARVLAGQIDRWKNQGLTPAKIPEGEAFSFANGKGRDIYAAYQARLKVLNAVDFGDLLLEYFRTAPAIDRLVVIADAADIATPLREQPQPQILRDIGILIFIDEDIFEALLILRKHIGIVLKQPQTFQQQIPEIDRIQHFQPGLIGGVDVLWLARCGSGQYSAL